MGKTVFLIAAWKEATDDWLIRFILGFREYKVCRRVVGCLGCIQGVFGTLVVTIFHALSCLPTMSFQHLYHETMR